MSKLAVSPTETHRACKHCGVAQLLERFPRAKSTSPGLYYEHKCKTCYALRAKEKYQSDPAQRARQIARSMNTAVAKRTKGRITNQVNVEALTTLILSASTCTYCRGPLGTFGYAVDHIIPLARNGPHTLEDLAVACQPCNRAKGDLLESEFRGWLAGIAVRLAPTSTPQTHAKAPS